MHATRRGAASERANSMVPPLRFCLRFILADFEGARVRSKGARRSCRIDRDRHSHFRVGARHCGNRALIPGGRTMKKLPRRQFLRFAAATAALPTLSPTVRAQAYPAQPVRIIVGFAAGSGSDILARLMAQWLSERLGQPIVIENRAGAGGNVGTEAVVKAPPDGYTLLKVVPANPVNDTLYDKLPFNFR